MTLGLAQEIDLVIEPDADDHQQREAPSDTLTLASLDSLTTHKARTRIAADMEATLIASQSDFEIISIEPGRQAVSDSMSTEWGWNIKPKRPGKHRVYLILKVFLDVDGRQLPRVVYKSPPGIIEVKGTWTLYVIGFISANWQWLWTTILVPVAAWFWKRRRHRKEEATKKPLIVKP